MGIVYESEGCAGDLMWLGEGQGCQQDTRAGKGQNPSAQRTRRGALCGEILLQGNTWDLL